MLSITKLGEIECAQEVCTVGDYESKIHSFFIDGLLIDTGPQSRQAEFTKWFKQRPINQVAITHNHEDHSGNAKWLQDNLEVPVFLHELAIPSAHEPGVYCKFRRDFWGDREIFNPQAMPETLETEKYKFQVLDTPGHALYHNCFFEPSQGWLFTGDLYVGSKQLVCIVEENMRQTIDTIDRLLKLDFDTVFCAHGGVIENGKIRLGKKRDYLLSLQENVCKLRAKGLTDREIDNELNGFVLDITPMSGGDWSSYNIIRTL